MAEFKIGQFRYTWKGPWVAETDYKRDDVVSVGANSYVCVVTHTADEDFYVDLNYIAPGDTAPSPKWVVMTQGNFSWQGDWTSGTQYNNGDVVQFGGYLYICNTGHLASSTFAANSAKWNVYAVLVSYKGAWTPNTYYGPGDLVRYGGYVIKCINEHTSGSDAEGAGSIDQIDSNWETYFDGIIFRGDWTPETIYRINELVLYNGTVHRCIEDHTSDEARFDLNTAQWQVEFYGQEFDQEWTATINYGVGSIVRHGGWVWYATRAGINHLPTESIISSEAIEDYWTILSKAVRYRGSWTSSDRYLTGDLVRKGGNVYRALNDSPPADEGNSTLDYLDDTNWELVIPGQAWQKDWSEDVIYFPGDLVMFEGDVYECNYGHTSSDQNYPGDNGSGFNYWDLTIEAANKQGMRARGDLLTYDLSRGLAGDGSTFAPTGVRIGDNPGKLLTINSDDSIFYDNFGLSSRTFYVSTDGVDTDIDPLRGISEYLPWRTVRYACEKANDGWTGTTKVSIAAGVYEEVLPIIIPARTAVVGAELRTTTIKPKLANPALSTDYTYTISALGRVLTILPFVITGSSFTKTPTNPFDFVQAQREKLVTIPVTNPETGTIENQEVLGLVDVFGTAETSGLVETLINQIIVYLQYYLGDGEDLPTVTGINDPVTDEEILDTVAVLLANKDFIAAEAAYWARQQFPAYNFDIDACQRDIRAWLHAWVHDIQYTGNYRTLLGARYYKNAVLGSETEDMFYLRDATGLRNCTLKGLTGTLNPPGVFDLYRRPTGGSFCSLDPGWGPDHEECWISTRSPYIQNVTNIGENCIGQKIDGALHNGGNKSMVSNDFTQVVDDGIGAWVLNNGRAELVSVFTYYNSIGYLAERGGIIRATNGNNSYGRYGAISDGVDPTEVPLDISVNNRNNEATVASTFAGEFNDEIYAFEYSNAGQNYTQASATIIGSGVGASVVYDDFRDNAIFEARLLDIADPEAIGQLIGGSGYSVAQNNAQPHLTPGGDAYSITLASNDPNTEADYLGKRIVITGGTGTGQYGYITAYDDETKVVLVSKETNGQPGWDHIFPGTPNKIPFDTTTFYRIEPRPVFSEPDYQATQVTVPASTTWRSMIWGETYQLFTNLRQDYPEDTDAETIALGALWRVEKVGREYVVTLTNGGSGYTNHQELTISGTNVGGTSPLNDITITITSVSNDSTNSILSFVYEGTASTGVFVALTAGGSVGTYSSNGTTWTSTFNMPSAGDWKCLAAVTEDGDSDLTGNVRFVAIQYDSGTAASSSDGITWTARTIASRQWNDVCYGEGKFIAVSGNNNNFARSTNGTTWTLGNMPTFGDSSSNSWVAVCYGKGRFVAIANTGNIAAYSDDGITWDAVIMDVISDSAQRDWISVAYGNNRFVAISSQGDIGYSFDGEVWLPAEMPTQDGSTAHNWVKIKYGNGIFFAVGDTAGRNIGGDPSLVRTNWVATSPDGIHWTGRTVASTQEWNALAQGNPYISADDSSVGISSPCWVIAGKQNVFNRVRVGARALGRVTVGGGVIGQVKLWDPGSGYYDNPSLQIIDPNVGTNATVEIRVADGVLSQPSWIDRGTGYRTVSTRVSITGNGFADKIPAGKFVTINGFETYPGPGAQIIFDNNDTLYTVVALTELGQLNGELGGLSALVRLSPDIKVRDQLEHGTIGILRSQYSQCRITGHDFLDIGTGNFAETNYPELYSTLYVSGPENEVYEEDGGRVFYTSTDQSGNFRCGELFAVEQATGIVTISADFFDFSGLSELRLGGIRVGGTGAVIREFSTDPTFTEDSNNIVPTQRAIASYLANRLSVGGSEIATASFIAGLVKVGPAEMKNTLGGKVVVPVRAEFEGAGPESGGGVGVRGSILAQAMFLATDISDF
jgi:hypothetical protein